MRGLNDRPHPGAVGIIYFLGYVNLKFVHGGRALAQAMSLAWPQMTDNLGLSEVWKQNQEHPERVFCGFPFLFLSSALGCWHQDAEMAKRRLQHITVVCP